MAVPAPTLTDASFSVETMKAICCSPSERNGMHAFPPRVRGGDHLVARARLKRFDPRPQREAGRAYGRRHGIELRLGHIRIRQRNPGCLRIDNSGGVHARLATTIPVAVAGSSVICQQCSRPSTRYRLHAANCRYGASVPMSNTSQRVKVLPGKRRRKSAAICAAPSLNASIDSRSESSAAEKDIASIAAEPLRYDGDGELRVRPHLRQREFPPIAEGNRP